MSRRCMAVRGHVRQPVRRCLLCRRCPQHSWTNKTAASCLTLLSRLLRLLQKIGAKMGDVVEAAPAAAAAPPPPVEINNILDAAK